MLRQSYFLLNFWRNESLFNLKFLHSKCKQSTKGKSTDVCPERYPIRTTFIQHRVEELLREPEREHDVSGCFESSANPKPDGVKKGNFCIVQTHKKCAH